MGWGGGGKRCWCGSPMSLPSEEKIAGGYSGTDLAAGNEEHRAEDQGNVALGADQWIAVEGLRKEFAVREWLGRGLGGLAQQEAGQRKSLGADAVRKDAGIASLAEVCVGDVLDQTGDELLNGKCEGGVFTGGAVLVAEGDGGTIEGFDAVFCQDRAFAIAAHVTNFCRCGGRGGCRNTGGSGILCSPSLCGTAAFCRRSRRRSNAGARYSPPRRPARHCGRERSGAGRLGHR